MTTTEHETLAARLAAFGFRYDPAWTKDRRDSATKCVIQWEREQVAALDGTGTPAWVRWGMPAWLRLEQLDHDAMPNLVALAAELGSRAKLINNDPYPPRSVLSDAWLTAFRTDGEEAA